MPEDVAVLIYPDTLSWTVRMSSFVLSGAIIGAPMEIYKYHVKRINFLATHDPETDIFNRRALLATVDQLDAPNTKSDHAYSLIVINHDNMPEVTSTFGFRAGDRVIQENFRRLTAALPEAEIFHYHRDRLAILLKGTDSKSVDEAVRTVEKVILPSIWFKQVPLHLVPFIGYATRAADVDFKHRMIIYQAEMAMLHTKAKKRKDCGLCTEID
jgi:diguanylate cyclase (GGDEF)-like protein